MANLSVRPDLRIAVAGLGAIGARVVEALDRGIDGLVLTAVSAQNPEKHRSRLASLTRMPAVLPIEALVDVADIVIECAPSQFVRSIVAPFAGNGKTAVVLSAGALLDHEDLVELAKQNGGQIVVPTGRADWPRRRDRCSGRDNPFGPDGNPEAGPGTRRRSLYRRQQHRHRTITEPLKVFDGSAREAAKGFPANVNVAAALSLAGIGPDRTKIEIWADPALTRNMHRIDVESDSARFSMSIENIPSENPKTGLITALSVIACLRKLRASLRVGT